MVHSAPVGNGIQSVTTTGPFSIAHDCPIAPAMATNCTLQVSFTPTVPGSITGRLTISGSADLSHAPLRLSGNGDDSAPPIGDTPMGSNVEVEIPVTLPDGSPALVEVTFGNVTTPGITSVAASSSPASGTPAVPAGFKVGNPPVYYDVSTNADVTGSSIRLCFGWNEGQFADESTIRLWHLNGGVWEDITTLPVDTANNVVCGVSSSLSPFVLTERAFAFAGFFNPVGNAGLNAVKPGAAVPFKFSLGANYGLAIFAPGYPNSVPFDCARWMPGTAIDALATAGNSTLTYDAAAGQYIYVWKTEKAWAGTCRQLIVKLADGSTHLARFKLK